VKRFAITLLILMVFFCAPPVRAAQGSHNFLWSVKGARGTVYLLGSIHVLKPSDYPLAARIIEAYAGSRRVMFEADMREMGGKAVQKALLDQGTYKDTTSLKDHISAKTYGLLARKLADAGLPESQFDKYKPWLCAVSLSGAELGRLGFDPRYGVDAHFFTRASGEGKEMIFLETASSQITLLSKTLADRQEDLLKQSLRELEVIGARYEEIRKAWKNGDEGKMEGISSVSLKEYPAVKKALFTDRNARWIPKIEALMNKDGDSLVIVGAGHLVGEDGILALLRDKGHLLTQH
jgi:uncharacterized protein YbaP (TraB family)